MNINPEDLVRAEASLTSSIRSFRQQLEALETPAPSGKKLLASLNLPSAPLLLQLYWEFELLFLQIELRLSRLIREELDADNLLGRSEFDRLLDSAVDMLRQLEPQLESSPAPLQLIIRPMLRQLRTDTSNA